MVLVVTFHDVVAIAPPSAESLEFEHADHRLVFLHGGFAFPALVPVDIAMMSAAKDQGVCKSVCPSHAEENHYGIDHIVLRRH